MKTTDIKEKIYFQDKKSKITNIRLTCNHLSTAIGNIDCVDIKNNVRGFTASMSCLLLACACFFLFALCPNLLKGVVIVAISMLILTSSIFVHFHYKNCYELVVLLNGIEVKLLRTGIFDKPFLENICNKIGEAIIDEKKFSELKNTGDLATSLEMNPSKTMILKKVVDEFECLRNEAEEFHLFKIKPITAK